MAEANGTAMNENSNKRLKLTEPDEETMNSGAEG
jgi:hypothetical protein